MYKGKKSKESLELKEEMRQHLIETVIELKNEGVDEDLAINTAISRFGDSNILKKDLNDFLKSHQKLSNKIKIYSLVGIIAGILIMCFGIFTNNIDSGWGQFQFYKINDFDTSLPLEKTEIEFLNKLIKNKKLNKVVYFKLYKMEDTTKLSERIQPTLLHLAHEEFKNKTFIEAYAYGNPENIYNQVSNYVDSGNDSPWYIEYELNKNTDYYFNICVGSAYGLWIISLGGLFISYTINKWRNKKLKYI